MRSLVRVLVLLLISFSLATAMMKSSPKKSKSKPEPEILKDSSGDEDDNKTVSISTESTSVEDEESEEEKESEFFSMSKIDINKAWNAAANLADRNPSIWRKDKKNNVILSRALTISSPLAFRALVKPGVKGGSVSFEAIQEEYYGEGEEDNHENALKYRAKDQEQDDFLSLIEIALNGHVSDDRGDSYCWVPSLIHQDLFLRDHAARGWHQNLFSLDFKYGMAGHNLAFQQMGVGLKDVRRYSEKVLDALDQVNDFMYIQNYQHQCSDVISQISFVEDKAKLAEKIKNNWGLPRVDAFIDPKAAKKLVPGAVVAKQKKLSNVSSSSAAKKVTVKPNLSEQEWPSLSMSSSSSKGQGKTNKSGKRAVEV